AQHEAEPKSPVLHVDMLLAKRCHDVNSAGNIVAIVRQSERRAHGADRGFRTGGETLRREIVSEIVETIRDAVTIERERDFGRAGIAEASAAQSDAGAARVRFDDLIRNRATAAIADVERDRAAAIDHR